MRLLLVACLLSVVAAPIAGNGPADRAPLDETEKIVHVLNRLGYGPRPGDIEAVRTAGVSAYIERQLWPESLDDRVVDEKIKQYRTLRMPLEQLVDISPPVDPHGRRKRETALRKREVMGQSADATTNDAAREMVAPAGPARAARERAKRTRASEFEYIEARLIRATLSERQLQELMVDFWLNHFNIDYGDEYLIVDFEEHVIRPHALGRFEDLLKATARHPAMLEYLNNWRSAAPEAVIHERIAALAAGSLEDQQALARRRPFLKLAKGLNENYARELMELHTLGVDGGYKQQDVIQVAKCFTGWTIVGRREEMGLFGFDPLVHEPGDKVVLGQTIPSGGMDEGERVLTLLSHHPSTARFIATKLVRRFVADDPPADVVQRAAQAFQRSNGDIREVLRAIFASPQFYAPRYYQAKIKKPIELVVSSLRAVNADVDVRWTILDQITTPMGENLYDHPSPDGFPDRAEAWVNTNALFRRLEFAFALATGALNGIVPQIAPGRALLRQMGMPEPSAAQLTKAVPLLKPPASGAQANYAMMAEQTMGMGGAAGRTQTMAGADQVAVAAMLGSPRFQKR